MFAALDTLITLVIFAGIALVSHFIRRARGGDEFEEPTEPPDPGPRRTTPEPKRMTWEEELRKVLEQRLPEPPPIVREMPRPAPTVYVPQPEPPPFAESAESHVEIEAPEPRFQPVPQFTESAGFERASHLQETVAKHFDELTHRRVGSTTAHHREPSREAREVLAMLRNPKTARTAILASLILGPPRALAE